MFLLTRAKTYFIKMAEIPTCCLMASSMFLLCLSTMLIGSCTAGTTQAPATTTAAPPFYQTSMFIGLMAGLGGFVAFIILVCIVWRCTCGGK